jgi:DNA-3-methyladenine glycosylase
MKLPIEYYRQPDLIFLSRDLIGKFLITRIGDKLTSGIIIETAAYHGPEDRASHAYGGRRTNRNKAMYSGGGISYVFCCYGIHYLFNVVTNVEDIPHAILIRAIEPTEGIPEMLQRRNKRQPDRSLTSGPGTLTQALGINLRHNAYSLDGSEIWIEDRGVHVTSEEILAGPRVGINYAGEDAKLPWRFIYSPC